MHEPRTEIINFIMDNYITCVHNSSAYKHKILIYTTADYVTVGTNFKAELGVFWFKQVL